MANTFSLEIKTPDELLFSGEVESLVVPHPDGLEGYLANHEPVIRELTAGTIQYDLNEIQISGGFLAFSGNQAVVFIR